MSMSGASLIYDYLYRVKSLFTDKIYINRAISKRRIIFDLTDINSHPNLTTLKKQFNSDGNKLKSATYRFIDSAGSEGEIQLFLRSDNITDRERIALISIFHVAANAVIGDLIEMDRGIITNNRRKKNPWKCRIHHAAGV
jgi:hypothetical protein